MMLRAAAALTASTRPIDRSHLPLPSFRGACLGAQLFAPRVLLARRVVGELGRQRSEDGAQLDQVQPVRDVRVPQVGLEGRKEMAQCCVTGCFV